MGYKEARAMLDREEQSQKEFERKMGGAKVLDWMWKERLRRMKSQRTASGVKDEPSLEKRVRALEKHVAALNKRLKARA
jgi:hypothetical protein